MHSDKKKYVDVSTLLITFEHCSFHAAAAGCSFLEGIVFKAKGTPSKAPGGAGGGRHQV